MGSAWTFATYFFLTHIHIFGLHTDQIEPAKLIASYVVSPQSSFTCEPCCIYHQASKTRHTYCALAAPHSEIRRFSDGAPNVDGKTSELRTSTLVVKGSGSPIVHLDTLPRAGHSGHPFDILAVQEDLTLRRLSGDLGEERWSLNARDLSEGEGTPPSKNARVHMVSLLDFQTARSSVLQRREDLTTLLMGEQTEGEGVTGHSVLLLVTSTSGRNSVTLLSVPSSTPHATSFSMRPGDVRHLLTQQLPGVPPSQSDSEASFSFHSPSSSLYCKTSSGITVYDLSQYNPKTTAELPVLHEPFLSHIRLSSSNVLVVTESSFSVYDLSYGSLQASTARHSPRVQKVNEATGLSRPGDFTIVSHFARLDLVVGISGISLVALRIAPTRTLATSSRKRKHGTLLADALTRGREFRTDGEHQPGQLPQGLKTCFRYNSTLESRRPYLDSQIEQLSSDSIRSFEKETAKLFSIPTDGFQYVKPDKLQKRLPTLMSEASLKRMAKLKPSMQPQDQEILLYVLGRIFSLEKPQSGQREGARLKIGFMPLNIFQCIVASGSLTTHNIETALNRQETSRQPRSKVAPGALIDAISSYDKSLSCLHFVLLGSPHLGLPNITNALTLILSQLSRVHSRHAPRLLTNGTEDETGSQPTTTSALTATLNTTLLRLHAHPLPSVTRSLRSLPITLATTLVHNLRLSLAAGGWTSHYAEHHTTPEPSSTLPLITITDLLSASLSALGVGGFLSNSLNNSASDEGADEADNLIAYMKAEVSAALAGIEEATYLQGFLREVLRYGNTAAQVFTRQHAIVTKGQMAKAETLPLDGERQERKLLPLGLKAEHLPSLTRVGSVTGQVVQKKRRDLGIEKSMRVGEYSFERILL